MATAAAVRSPSSAPEARTGVAPITRVASIDAFRGFVMFLMLAEAMRLWTLHDAFPASALLGDRRLQHHARSLAGLFAPRPDPAGVLVPRRRVAARSRSRAAARRGETFGTMLGHAVRRSLILILLGHLPPLDGDARRPTGRSRTRSPRSGSATRSSSCWRSRRGACRSACSWRSSSASGRRSRSTRCRPPSFDYTSVGVPAGLAAPLHRVPRPLQHELEPVVGVRHVVPEPVPARVAVPVQRRRLVDPQLHPHAGHDDAGRVGGGVAEAAGSEDANENSGDSSSRASVSCSAASSCSGSTCARS